MNNSKFDSRTTAIKCDGIYGKVHCSVTYVNDEPDHITFAQHRDEEYDKTSHFISLYKTDLKELIKLLKENELI